MRTECNRLHIHKFPAFAVFKPDFGHEMHHGNCQQYMSSQQDRIISCYITCLSQSLIQYRLNTGLVTVKLLLTAQRLAVKSVPKKTNSVSSGTLNATILYYSNGFSLVFTFGQLTCIKLL